MSNFYPKAIIFDMDGVILDTESICDKCWQIIAERHNLKNFYEALQKCRGCNKTDSMQILKEFFGPDFDSQVFLAESSAEFRIIEDRDGINLMPYAREALDYLSNKYTIALASSTRYTTVMRQLGNLNLCSYFKTFTCGDMVVHSKPEPDIYLMACKSLNLSPEECVAIEDSPNGLKSAYAAGIKTILIPDKVQPTEAIKNMAWKVCSNLKEVLSFL